MAATKILDPRSKDLTGKQFYDLTVITPTAERQGNYYVVWICRCKCGAEIRVSSQYLRKGTIRNCGCVKTERAARPGREYSIWTDMKSRCYNQKSKRYPRYGARGVRVCERWHDFAAFLDDMGPCPTGHTLDRADNDGHYEPSNCRWATNTQQLRNFSRNRLLTFNGETRCLSEWAEIAGVKASTLAFRLRSGWPLERAMATPAISGGNHRLPPPPHT